MDKNSLSFIRFQCILHDSGVLFGVTLNFYKLKRGNLISGGTQFCGKSEFFCPPLLYFNFKSFMDPISWSFIRFQCILDDSGVPSSESSNVQKLKRGNLIFGGNQFCRRSELFGHPFCISILNFLWTQIHLHPLDFNAFCENQEYFSESLEMNRN